ncbi:MAG: secondary thiamine-phosphate synthase enzyme YjbQ [bacterium]
MSFQQHIFSFSSSKPLQILEITGVLREFVESSGVERGLLSVASPHTTVAVMINERCEKLQEDMIDFLGSWIPAQGDYRHNRVAVDGRPNAHSHLLSMAMPSQVSIVVSGGKLDLGQWQSVFAVELDGPRPERKIRLTLIGV